MKRSGGPWWERRSVDPAPGKKHQMMGLDERRFGDTSNVLWDPGCLFKFLECLELPTSNP